MASITKEECNELLRKIGQLQGMIDKVVTNPTLEKQQISVRLTEVGMWLRLYHDLEAAEAHVPEVKSKVGLLKGHTHERDRAKWSKRTERDGVRA